MAELAENKSVEKKKAKSPAKNPRVSMEDIATMVANINARLDLIENNQKKDTTFDLGDALKGLDDSLELDRKKVNRRSTMGEAEIPRLENSKIQATLTIPPFEHALIYLKPRTVIRFIAEVQVYQSSYNTIANLSRCFQPGSTVASTIIAASNNEYNINNLGNITLDRFTTIMKRHFQQHTQAGFINQIKLNTKFPPTNVKEINHYTFAEFRSLLKQYTNDFLSVYDLFNLNELIIPPVTTNKENGLIYCFNLKIPFDYGTGIYNQIGYNGPSRVTFGSIQEYLEMFNNRIDMLYEISNSLKPMYDAINKPDKLPDAPKVFKNFKKEVNELCDSRSIMSEESYLTSSDTTNAEVKAIMGPMKDQDKSKLPCHSYAINKECKRINCPYSHDETICKNWLEKVKSAKHVS
jgi:hypothetical protein